MSSCTDNNVYIKRGKKYVPFGLRYDERYLPDGIWFIHHDDHSAGHTNADHYLSGLYKVGDVPKYVDIPELCSMHSYTEYVLNSPEFKAIMESGKFSFLELTSKIVALVVDLNKTLKEQEKRTNGTR